LGGRKIKEGREIGIKERERERERVTLA
jgi:hypothetical protein